MQHARREQIDTYKEFTTACITQFYQSSDKQTFLLLCFNTIFWSNSQYWIGIVEEKGATKPANVHAPTLEKHSNSEPHSTRNCKSTCHNTWKDTPNSNPHSTRTCKSTCCNTGENTLNSNPHSTRTCKSTCHTGKNTLNSNPYSTRMSKSSCHNTGKTTPDSPNRHVDLQVLVECSPTSHSAFCLPRLHHGQFLHYYSLYSTLHIATIKLQ